MPFHLFPSPPSLQNALPFYFYEIEAMHVNLLIFPLCHHTGFISQKFLSLLLLPFGLKGISITLPLQGQPFGS